MIFAGLIAIWCLLSLPLLGRSVVRARSHFNKSRPWTVSLDRALRDRRVWSGAVWAVLLIFALHGVTRAFEIYVNAAWMRDLGYVACYWTDFWTEVLLFWIAFLFAGSFLFLQARLFFRLTPFLYRQREALCWTIAGSFLFLYARSFAWDFETFRSSFLLFLHQQPFGKLDPVFSHDLGLYIFTLPVIQGALDEIIHLIWIAMLMAACAHGAVLAVQIVRARFGKILSSNWRSLAMNALFQLAVIGWAMLATFLLEVFDKRYKILYSTHGHVYGAGWADLHVRIPAYWCFAILSTIVLLWLAGSRRNCPRHAWVRHALCLYGLLAVCWWAGVKKLPDLVQTAYVDPNELRLEAPFLAREIEFTRSGFGLDKVKIEEFPVQDGLTSENLRTDAVTLDSARLWDPDVLLSINHQLQAFRSYYSFADADVVRYTIDGKPVQLLYSGRELDTDLLPDDAKTWQNLHLVYTHGFGGVAAPVNAFSADGLPEYWLKNIPVEGTVSQLRIDQPRIYFGESTSEHIYVNTRMDEFDSPDASGVGNHWNRYDGPAGIRLGGFWSRLAIAWMYDGVFKLWSNELTAESRILVDRDVKTRTDQLLPPMDSENDIYQVVADGQLWYMRDFETTSGWYPYSLPNNETSYIRNSVKAVVNAYTGKTDFYVFDEQDPILRAYREAYPTLFKPASEMPASLRVHIRYPEGLMQQQAEVYSRYHMTDVASFYNQEDVWQSAMQYAPSINQAAWMNPYYVLMTLPGESKPEFVLIQPFTPKSTDEQHQRNNLEAWMAARCDPEHFGELLVYKFPNTRQVQGPLQVGGRLNQDAEMSKNFTQWNQQGSKVILGDMRVLPLSDHRLLSVQSIFLESEGVGVQMPQLMYVVAASGDRVVYGKSFDEALQLLIHGGAQTTPTQIASSDEGQKNAVSNLLVEHLRRYFSLLRQMRLDEAGKELQTIQKQIDKHNQASQEEEQ